MQTPWRMATGKLKHPKHFLGRSRQRILESKRPMRRNKRKEERFAWLSKSTSLNVQRTKRGFGDIHG
ncbi:hypothetical protein K1719_046579 [Acacia pycnantha]|nr:hypothetical protein K1719_046579 [Acacia pycnantha]